VSPLTASDVERRLAEAFADARSTIVEHPDLFARVERSIEEDRARRRFRRRFTASVALFIVVLAALAAALADTDQGRIVMPWWAIELITNIVLIALAVALGPFIKRFGRAYAADVFRANPRTGKSYLVLTDIAYYLIFVSYIFFTVRFSDQDSWTSTAEQLQWEFARVGGFLLIMGILHTANVIALPVIGTLLRAGRSPAASTTGARPRGRFVVHVEPASDEDAAATTD